MLRVTVQRSASAAKKYYQAGDYYTREGQGHWGGQGTARLRLEGRIEKLPFERLCDDLHPETGARLTLRTKAEPLSATELSKRAKKARRARAFARVAHLARLASRVAGRAERGLDTARSRAEEYARRPPEWEAAYER